jgi:hypothetical protein
LSGRCHRPLVLCFLESSSACNSSECWGEECREYCLKSYARLPLLYHVARSVLALLCLLLGWHLDCWLFCTSFCIYQDGRDSSTCMAAAAASECDAQDLQQLLLGIYVGAVVEEPADHVQIQLGRIILPGSERRDCERIAFIYDIQASWIYAQSSLQRFERSLPH